MGQVLRQPPGFRGERRPAHMGQYVVDKLQVVHDVLRIPHLWQVDQDVAHAGTPVILVHLGYLSRLLTRVGLVYADAVRPHVLHAGADHQPPDVF